MCSLYIRVSISNSTWRLIKRNDYWVEHSGVFCGLNQTTDTFWSVALSYFAQGVTHRWVVLLSVENTCRLLAGLPSYSRGPLVPHWCMSHCFPVCGGENVHWQKPCENRSSQYSDSSHHWRFFFSIIYLFDMVTLSGVYAYISDIRIMHSVGNTITVYRVIKHLSKYTFLHPSWEWG